MHWRITQCKYFFCLVTYTIEHSIYSHNTFASGGSDGTVSIWDHNAKKRMKQYPAFPTEVSCLAFSPDGEKLAIGASYEHDNGIAQPDQMGKTALLIKTTVMDDCRVSLGVSFTIDALLTSSQFEAQNQGRLDSGAMVVLYRRSAAWTSAGESGIT